MRGRADAHRDNRLPERDDDDQSMPLDEVAWGDLEARIRGSQRGQDDHRDRDSPKDAPAACPRRFPPPESRLRPTRFSGATRRIAVADAPAWLRVKRPAWIRTTTRYATPNAIPPPPNAVGIGERDHEKGRHPAQQQELIREPVRRDDVRQPDVSAVHPPDHDEHQHDAQDADPIRMVREHARQLRDREDEDEIEEELERRNPSLRARVHRGASRHGPRRSCAPPWRKYAKSSHRDRLWCRIAA